MLNRIKSVTQRRFRAKQLILSLTTDLENGWNPWASQGEERKYTPFSDAIKLYNATIARESKLKTRQTYQSRIKTFLEFLETKHIKLLYAYEFDVQTVTRWLDYLFLVKGISPRTRNNYRDWAVSLGNFFVEKGYIEKNPLSIIKKIKNEPKLRQPLTREELHRLSCFLQENDKHFYLACLIEYYSFIRPGELSNVRIDDINLQEQSIFISAEFAKNRRDEKVAINDEIIKLMLDLDIFKYPNHYYLFGKDMKPSDAHFTSEQFRRRWNNYKKKLQFGEELQFYSLKDSGLRDLANRAGVVVARDQARHTDISTTNKYLQGKDKPIHSEIKHYKGYL